jgi:hypothetical protein
MTFNDTLQLTVSTDSVSHVTGQVMLQRQAGKDDEGIATAFHLIFPRRP